MKQKVLLLLASLLLGASLLGSKSEAQNVMDKGVSHASFSLGLWTNTFIPTFSYDYGVIGNLFDDKSSLSIGGMLSLYTKGYTVNNSRYRQNGILIGPKVALHYHFIPKLDTYFSLTLGYMNSFGSVDNQTSSRVSEFLPGYHIGARYAFTPKLAGLLELGYGFSFTNIGISYIF